jgi:L-ascorbate metabolism protein UlaG (beta-lactamase superfamily)
VAIYSYDAGRNRSAAADLNAKTLLPVHWGKFTLSMHAWTEPVKRILEKAKTLNVKVVTPKIGEPVPVISYKSGEHWWNF